MPTEDPPTSASLSSLFCGVAGTVTSMVTVEFSCGSSLAGVVVSAAGSVVRVGCTRCVVAFCSPVTFTVRCTDIEVVVLALVDSFGATASDELGTEATGEAVVVVAVVVVGSTVVVSVADVGCCEGAALVDDSTASSG